MIDQLQEQIKVVARARAIANDFTNAKNNAYTQWEEKHKTLLTAVEDIKVTVQVEEEKLRELTLQAYAETGNKAPAPGVGIRERIVLTYETKIAFDWAKAHRMALRLDTTAFEKIAKVDPPDFVKITTEPQAIIATNLEEKK